MIWFGKVLELILVKSTHTSRNRPSVVYWSICIRRQTCVAARGLRPAARGCEGGGGARMQWGLRRADGRAAVRGWEVRGAAA
jgi:hypothetical protein